MLDDMLYGQHFPFCVGNGVTSCFHVIRPLDIVVESATNGHLAFLHLSWYKTLMKACRESIPRGLAKSSARRLKSRLFIYRRIHDGCAR